MKTITTKYETDKIQNKRQKKTRNVTKTTKTCKWETNGDFNDCAYPICEKKRKK